MALPRRFQVCAWLIFALTLSFSAASHAGEADVRRIWQLLDYLAVDYAGAVRNGAVVSATEFEEMREFAKTSQTKMAALDPHPERAALVAEAQTLSAAIEGKKSSEEVAALAKSLANHLLTVYPVPSSPAAPPQVAQAATVYQAQCAACHGATGNGDGPAGLKLDPRPVAFTDKDRARERSAFALYQAITQGIDGTAMPSFPAIPESDRWALAFFIGQFAHAEGEATAGQKIWAENAAVRAQLTSLDLLSRTTQADLAKQVGEEPAAVTMAYLQAHPEAVVQNRAVSFDVARQKLTYSLQAVQMGEASRATDLALSAYLDGIEPIEPTLATRDSALMGRIEAAMGKYRSLLAEKTPLPELQAQVNEIDVLFKEADVLLGSSADATAAYLGSLTILVREGLEALLVIVAMIAFLRKAERTDMLRYVHAGWVGAIAVGVVTWGVATYFVSVSGASREVTEGLSSLFAAIVLLSVGMWMHQKSMAGAWQKYIHDKLSAALSRKSAWFMFGLSFIAVYREVFESILFYAALWEQGNHHAVLGGLASGATLLAIVAVALFRFSAHLPIGKFFSWSSALVAVLAVVLTGKGIADLQEAGWLGASSFNGPRVDLLGIHPSLQGVAAQLLMSALVAAGFLWNARVAAKRSAARPS